MTDKEEVAVPKLERLSRTILDVDQMSEEWFEARLGKYTSSRINSVMQSKKNKGYMTVATSLLCERRGGERKMFTSKITDHGIEAESKALSLFSLRLPGATLTRAPYVMIDTTPFAASCDYFRGADEIVEIKSPVDPGVHFSRVINGTFDKEVIHQVNWQMGVTERHTAYLVSYLSMLPIEECLYIQKIKFDPKLWNDQVGACVDMEMMIDTFEEKLKESL